ncbi:type IV toxin-antitoxin system AbiEi family antitoxin domain-containing protein [Microlunatus sp. GCM10028923]|uniref:type IV toxin-antitoxin system AbiEi family antitoxin domain-containing protein n=1 Tax=Microlunatus sp. GCM10028923 TaxID=3273400 RepID=UPI003615E3E7
MSEVVMARQLAARGYRPSEIARLVRRGELTRIRRGGYVTEEADGERDRHRRLIDATLRLSSTDVVVSHLSAGVLHGLPIFRDTLKRVDLTRSGRSGGYVRRAVHLHVGPLTTADRVILDGRPVTSLARTVVDVARRLPERRAVALADAALTRGLLVDQAAAVVGGLGGHTGIGRARRVLEFADGRSESVGESEGRVVMAVAGLPRPTLQYEVHDEHGEFVARCDYAWVEQRTLGEFDGLIKYGRLLKPGETSSDVIVAEKLREDALRDLGWEVVRLIWSDLSRPAQLAARVRRAFTRAARRHA